MTAARKERAPKEKVVFDNDYALEQAAEHGVYTVRVEYGRTVTFRDIGGELEADVTTEQADYLQKIPGMTVLGREPYVFPKSAAPVDDFQLEGERLAKAKEQAGFQAPASSSQGALIDALVQALGGPQALLAALMPQIKPQVMVAAVEAKEQADEVAAEEELARGWRYRDVRNLDPDEAMILLEEYADANVDLGSLSDAALLKMLADKANVFPALDAKLSEWLAEGE